MRVFPYIVGALALALSASGQARVAPKTFLLSLDHLPLQGDDALAGFQFDTWGVDVLQVCRFPAGWTLTAGRHTNPSGTIAGRGSNGVSWLREHNRAALQNLMLVGVHDQNLAPAGQNDDAEGGIPARFSGAALVIGMDDEPDTPQTRLLGNDNIRLTPASRCRSRRHR